VESEKTPMEGLAMKFLQGKRIFITGGTGFVGSHVVEALVKAGASVITTYLIDDPRSYFALAGLENKVKKIHLDIREYEKVRQLLSRFEIEYVLHLAAQPLVDVAVDNPMYTLDTNIMGTASVLEAARLTSSVKGVIVASSDKAYGKHGKGKYTENDRLTGDHPYEVSKSAADLICTTYFKTYKLPVIVTRFGNIYGEGDLNYSRIIPGIMSTILHKQELQIRSNGNYIRDYLYVKDVARGYLQLLEHFDKAKGEAFNFGSSETLSVLELLRQSSKILKKKIPHKILNIAKNEIPYQSLDFSKIQKTIGWSPKYSLKSTLPLIFRWYKKVENL
jgi:CDP-glucose 4,6-dehydratase